MTLEASREFNVLIDNQRHILLFYRILKVLGTYFCQRATVMESILNSSYFTLEIYFVSLRSSHWFEVGGAQLEKDNVRYFSAPFL